MAGGKITILSNTAGNIEKKKTISGNITSGGGTADHNRLVNRDLPDQHPIEAITDLEETLKAKLDSSTALPLIEDAVKNKAKGLYYDANKELARKAYWYLTSEVDPFTKQGTKASIISGPYDLGQGGGGGGGGGGVTDIRLDIAIDPETGQPIWPYNISTGAECIIGVDWSSLRDGQPTGRGNLYCYVNDELVESRNAAQGIVTFDITEYILSGTNKVEIKVIDAYSTTKNLIDTVNGVTLKLTSNFEDDISYTGPITYTYTPIGNIKKTVYFWVDGSLIGTEVVSTTGEQWTYQIPEQSHGAHTLKVYFIAKIDGADVYSNELNYDIICYKKGNTTPIIASTFNAFEQEQYASFIVRYRVYTPGKNNSTVYLYKDGKVGSPLSVPQDYQNWEVRFDEIGNHTLKIATGTVSKEFNVYVKESSIDVQPVTQALALALTSYGRSNTEPLEERSKWNYQPTTGDLIEGDLKKFNWTSNGWVLDDDGNTVLRVSGDARVEINYEPFRDDFTASGKTFEFEIATSDVKNYETRIIECLDGADTITYTQGYAGEDTRQLKFIVDSVDNAVFIAKVKEEKGTYLFTFDGTYWDLDGELVTHAQLLSEYGITVIEIGSSEEETSHYLPGDRITVYYTVSGRGFYITPQLAKLQSQQVSLSTQYKEDDKVRLSFVVEKRTEGTETFKTRLIYMYINGILSGVTKYPAGDSFQQNPVKIITIGSNDATLDIYNIRIYNNNLTRRQIVNNWIADTKDPILKTKRYKKNDNYNDEGEITIEKIAALGDLPYMVLNGPTLPAYKKDRKYMYITYTNPADDDRDFTSENARVDVQGTSSQYYYKKNFKIKFEGGFEDKNGNWTEHYKMRGDDSKKEKTFTFKADVASSEGANNVELVRYFEDSKNWYSPAELVPDEDIPGSTDSKKRIRVGIDGFPIVMFHNDETKTYFYGKMNFNNDKDNKRTFGFKDDDECWEFINNTTPLVLFKSDDLEETDPKGNMAWKNSFESRYPETAGDDEHDYGDLPEERIKLQSVVSWIYSTYRRPEDSEEEKTRKLNKFKLEFTRYFDKNSTLFYYLFTELFLMVDSRAKNAMLAYLKSRQPNDGGDKWFWMPYDMDTALGINNEGLLVFNYDKEDTDLQEGAFIYNGQDSVFWNNVRDAFTTELRNMYVELRNGNSERIGWSFDNAEKYFEDHQAKWSENIFNEDAQVKYLEPYINNQDATYLGMAQGSKLEQRRWWMYNRFKYLDSKYLTGDANKNTIMMRAYQRSNFELRPYMNCYLTAVFDQAQEGLTVTKKAEKGVTTEIVPPGGWDPQSTDSVVILYSADLIEDIGDISGFKAGYADFSAATKLKKIIVGSSDDSYRNEKFKALNVGANHLLTYLDARNCTSLGDNNSDKQGDPVTPTIDLRQCYSIEEAYFDGTQIKGCLFPVGGNLKKVHLPGTLTSLEIRNHPNLEEFVIDGTSNLTSLWLEDVPSSVINSYTYVMNMLEGSRVRLIGIDEKFDSVNQIIMFYDKLDQMTGIDSKGDKVDKVQITGKITIRDISYATYVALMARYPEVQIIATDGIYATVKFLNYETVIDETGEIIYNPVPYNSQSIKLGRDAIRPVDPTFGPTVSHVYEFDDWIGDFTNVQQDLTIKANYIETVRKYRVTFDTQSPVITVEPEYEDIDYNTLATEPTYSHVPEHVNFLGWYTDPTDGMRWNFNADKVVKDITLYAHWNDEDAPILSLNRISWNTFEVIGSDNVSIVGWAVTNTTDIPEEWNLISPTTFIHMEYVIEEANNYYFWIRDNQGNSTRQYIVARSVIRQFPEEGIDTISLKENGVEVDDFALIGTELTVHIDPDYHYENVILKLIIDGQEQSILNDSTFIVNEDTTVAANCTAKYYDIVFNTFGKGNPEPTQRIQYLRLIAEPSPQYADGQIIDGWYTDPTLSDESRWDFSDPFEGDDTLTLYARWIDYTEPTLLTIIPEWDETYETYKVTVGFYQTSYEGVEIDWDDGSSDRYAAANTSVLLEHEYADDEERIIKVKRIKGLYYLGYNSYIPAVMPITCLKRVDFAYDVTHTQPGAFKGATGLTEINLTEYMTQIDDSVFEGCSNIVSINYDEATHRPINLPKNIVSIGNRAFTDCSSLLGPLVLPENLSFIGIYAFANCTSLTSIAMNNNLLEVRESAFKGCTGVRTLNISSSLDRLHDSTFAVCSSLTEVDIPMNINAIGDHIFDSCSSLEKVILRNPNLKITPTYEEYANTLFAECYGLETIGPLGDVDDQGNEVHYNIEYAWTSEIPPYAFSAPYGWSPFKSAKLASTITKIGHGAFQNANQLVSINLPSGLAYIGDSAFLRCSSMRTDPLTGAVDIPFNVRYIGKQVFGWANGLTIVNIHCVRSDEPRPSTVNESWFRNCNKNLEIHLSNTFDNDIEVRDAFGNYWNYYDGLHTLSYHCDLED